MFEVGQSVGEMHCHTPSSSNTPLLAEGYRTDSVFEINDDQGVAIASTLPHGLRGVLHHNKQAYVVAYDDYTEKVMVIYWYDTKYFLTTLFPR